MFNIQREKKPDKVLSLQGKSVRDLESFLFRHSLIFNNTHTNNCQTFKDRGAGTTK